MPSVSVMKPGVSTEAIEPVVYCHRRQGKILIRESNGQFRVLLGKNASDGSPQFFAPYGIAVDQGRHGIWISDKLANAVWLAKFSISDMGTRSYGRFQFERFAHHAMRAPCTVDVHPSLGPLIACYGTTAEPGGLLRYDGSAWEDIVMLRALTPSCGTAMVLGQFPARLSSPAIIEFCRQTLGRLRSYVYAMFKVFDTPYIENAYSLQTQIWARSILLI